MKKKEELKTYIQSFNRLIEIIPESISSKLYQLNDEYKIQVQEIRIRINKPTELILKKNSILIEPNSTRKDIDTIFKNICNSSVYSFQEQIKNGFITFKGGHRVGIASSAVIEDNQIYNLRDITSLNIRIAKEFKGLSKNIYEQIKNDTKGTLIVGAPSSGKTTILRDLARILSKENNSKVTIIDEKNELASIYKGEPCMDIGMCDVLTGFPKSIGILRAIRYLSPNIIVCDEIGDLSDAKAINQSLNSGVRVIASIHAKDEKELMQKPQVIPILYSNAFEKIIFLKDSKSPGEISKIIKVGELIDVENSRSYFDSNIRYFDRLFNIT